MQAIAATSAISDVRFMVSPCRLPTTGAQVWGAMSACQADEQLSAAPHARLPAHRLLTSSLPRKQSRLP